MVNGSGASPLVSVLIPTHDRPRWLGDSIASALAQSYANLEVRVVDDGAKPSTRDVVARFADPRLIHDLSAPSAGIQANHRRATELARGEFVVFLSDDDVLLPDFVEHRMAHVRREPDLDVVFSGYEVVDEQMRPRRRFDPPVPDDRQLGADDLLGATLSRAWSINSSLYARRTLLEAWPPKGVVESAFDTAMHARMALSGRCRGRFGHWCDVRYRTHADQATRGDRAMKHFAEGVRMYGHVLPLATTPEQRRRILTDFAEWQVVWGRALCADGDLPAARRQFVAAIRTAPWVRGGWTLLARSLLTPSRLAAREQAALADG